MSHAAKVARTWQLDRLRLLGLSRIPRCTHCPRLGALRAAHGARMPIEGSPPPVPANCSYQVCAPLVARFNARS